MSVRAEPGVGSDQATDLTAPTLLWLHTRAARIVAAVFVAATVASLPNYGSDFTAENGNLPWLILSVAVVAVGIATLLATRTDPMPARSAAAAAASVPLGGLVAALALPGPVDNPNQTNALGAGVALCAFLCVRGRVGIAWAGQLAALAIITAWGWWTGQGLLAGFLVGLPNLAVLIMATMFARIMRPTATEVRDLRAREARARADISASRVRDAERLRQQDKLQRRAWPSMELIASTTALTPAQIADVLQLEAELRDSIRAPFFDTPEVRAAARSARARGVDVELLDDHGMDTAGDELAARFRAVAVRWLTEAADGAITVRVVPPGRAELATIIAIAADGEDRELSMGVDGAITTIP